jgi:hypothetical protein
MIILQKIAAIPRSRLISYIHEHKLFSSEFLTEKGDTQRTRRISRNAPIFSALKNLIIFIPNPPTLQPAKPAYRSRFYGSSLFLSFSRNIVNEGLYTRSNR